MKKQCTICEEWFTPEDVNLDPNNKKHVAAFNKRNICNKPLCARKRRRRHQNESFSKNENKVSGKVCDICGKRFYPIDYDLDMRDMESRNSWAGKKRCPNPVCHAQAVQILKERHSKGLGHIDEGLENSLLLSEVTKLRDLVFGTIQEPATMHHLQYRKMMGKRM